MKRAMFIALLLSACSAGIAPQADLPDVGEPDSSFVASDAGEHDGELVFDASTPDGGDVLTRDAGAPDAGAPDAGLDEYALLFLDGCTPCPNGDVTCPPEPSAHCEQRDPDRAPYCTMWCQHDAGCPVTATCTYIHALDDSVCLPKAGECEARP